MEPKNFIDNLNKLGDIYGLDKTQVQHHKDSLYYKFTEMISSIVERMLGSNSITKTQNILENQVKTASLTAQINQRLQLIQKKFPDLKEVIDQEKQEIKKLLDQLKFEFETEIGALETVKKSAEADPTTIGQKQATVQRMADKFLEFEEGLRTTHLKTDKALFHHLKKNIEKKFNETNSKIRDDNKIDGLNEQLQYSIKKTKNFRDLDRAVKLLNKIETYSKELNEGFEAQNQKLQEFGISPAIQEKIRMNQLKSLNNLFNSLKDINELDSLDEKFTGVLFVWSDKVLFEVAYDYVVQEHQELVAQTLHQLENPELKEIIKSHVDKLFKEADQKPDAQSKIRHLEWMRVELVGGMQTYLKQEVNKLEASLNSYDNILRGLQLDPEVWKTDIKKALTKKIAGIQDAESANALSKEISELKTFEKLNLLLNPLDQADILDKQMNFEIRKLEQKFPNKRTSLMLGFLGELGKGTLLEKVVESLTLASKSTSITDKENAIAKIHSITEEQIVEELKGKVREKSKEIVKQKEDDIAKMKAFHESYRSHYPWIADEQESSVILQQSTQPFNELMTPDIKDLDGQTELLKLITYTENQLINTQENIQKNYIAKKKEASEIYSKKFEQQIGIKLTEVMLPIYRDLTKASSNTEENATILKNFIEDKAGEIKAEITHSQSDIEKYKDLNTLKSLKDELKGYLESPIDKLRNMMGGFMDDWL